LKWTVRSDMPQIFDIEQRCFPDPWTEEEFLKMLRVRENICRSAWRGERVVGFLVYQLKRHELLIHNLAVHPEEQRLGVGRALLDQLKGKLSDNHRRAIVAPVADSNLDAQLVFRSQGFVVSEVEAGAFNDGRDAYRFIFRHGWPLPDAPKGTSV